MHVHSQAQLQSSQCYQASPSHAIAVLMWIAITAHFPCDTSWWHGYGMRHLRESSLDVTVPVLAMADCQALC